MSCGLHERRRPELITHPCLRTPRGLDSSGYMISRSRRRMDYPSTSPTSWYCATRTTASGHPYPLHAIERNAAPHVHILLTQILLHTASPECQERISQLPRPSDEPVPTPRARAPRVVVLIAARAGRPIREPHIQSLQPRFARHTVLPPHIARRWNAMMLGWVRNACHRRCGRERYADDAPLRAHARRVSERKKHEKKWPSARIEFASSYGTAIRERMRMRTVDMGAETRTRANE
ncbi:hypothetical protein C8R44DRAFT_895259 [Mycena epipterygia]|nr:hypothetical protein C8R44DRAFT_895259 [Mycena epipterygia]